MPRRKKQKQKKAPSGNGRSTLGKLTLQDLSRGHERWVREFIAAVGRSKGRRNQERHIRTAIQMFKAKFGRELHPRQLSSAASSLQLLLRSRDDDRLRGYDVAFHPNTLSTEASERRPR